MMELSMELEHSTLERWEDTSSKAEKMENEDVVIKGI